MHSGEGIRHYDQAAARLARHYGNCTGNFLRIVDAGCDRLNRKRAGHCLERFEEKRPPTWRSVGIEDDCRPRDAWRDQLEHFEPLSDHRRREISEAGCAAAWPSDTRYKMAAHWIGYAHEDDWNRTRPLQQRGCCGR